MEHESASRRPQCGRRKPAKSPATQTVSKDIAAYHAYVEVRAAVVGGGDVDHEGVRPHRHAVMLRLRLVAAAEKAPGFPASAEAHDNAMGTDFDMGVPDLPFSVLCLSGGPSYPMRCVVLPPPSKRAVRQSPYDLG